MHSCPTISLMHPTARVKPSEQFSRGWMDAFNAWVARADHRGFEYIVAVHESRWEAFWEYLAPLVAFDPSEKSDVIVGVPLDGGGFYPVRIVKNTLRDCVVDQTNCAYENSSGLLITGAADDYYPPEHWDTLLLEALEEGADYPECNFTSQELVLVCSTSPGNDARDRELMIGNATTRKVFERRGYVLDPNFESMFADNWWAFENRRDEKAGLLKIIERLDIQFDHRHPIFGKGRMDEAYRQQNRPEAYADGLITFKRKCGQKMIAICLPGQDFSSQWLHGWTVLYGHLMAQRGMLTMPIFAYTSNVHCTRMDLAKTILEARHKPDVVVSIDDDNILLPEQYDMLQQDLDDDPDLDGVVGWCWCDPADPLGDKNMPYVASCGRQKGWDLERNENGEGIQAKAFTVGDFDEHLQKTGRYVIHSGDLFPHAFWSGLPVILMRYESLKRLGAKAFQPMIKPEVKFGFTSEDTSFFYHTHQLGMRFGVDMRVKVPHLKLRAIEAQYLPGVTREQVLEAQGKTLGMREEVPV